MDDYAHVIAAVTSQAWAVSERVALIMSEILTMRMEGKLLSKEEIEARVSARKPAPVSKVRSDNVAIVPIHGMITYRASLFSDVSGMTSVGKIREEFDASLGDDSVDTVLLHLDSPGGSTDGIGELAEHIYNSRSQKRIVAAVDLEANSAAYHLASQAHEITATRSSQQGSVGVFTMHREVSRKLANDGISVEIIKAGKNKAEVNPFNPLTESARTFIQEQVDNTYKAMVSDIARGRGISTEAVEERFGQGRSFFAGDALAAGMIDRIESMAETLGRYKKAVAPKSRLGSFKLAMAKMPPARG